MPYKDAATRRAAYRTRAWADTSRAASKAAKRRRRGRCEECGTETRYNGTEGKAVSRLCLPCAAKLTGKKRLNKGPTVSRVLEFLAGGERTFTEIHRELGLSKNGLCWRLNRWMRDGRIERVARGRYRLATGPEGET